MAFEHLYLPSQSYQALVLDKNKCKIAYFAKKHLYLTRTSALGKNHANYKTHLALFLGEPQPLFVPLDQTTPSSKTRVLGMAPNLLHRADCALLKAEIRDRNLRIQELEGFSSSPCL